METIKSVIKGYEEHKNMFFYDFFRTPTDTDYANVYDALKKIDDKEQKVLLRTDYWGRVNVWLYNQKEQFVKEIIL